MSNSATRRTALPRIKDTPRRSGFTLVELLVVVGLLVLVIAMLVPALTKAQRQSRTLACLTNLRQLHLGFSTYLHQNRERSFVFDPSHQTFWLDVLKPSFPDVPGLLTCAEAATPSYGLGSATTAWGPFDAARGSQPYMKFIGADCSSYGFNGWLYATPDDLDAATLGFRARQADHIPVFAEATWVEGWPVMSDAWAASGFAAAGDDSGLQRFNIARHGRSINASFLDGHAEQIPLDRLPQVKWSNTGRFDPVSAGSR